jgi:outer membrane protein OmpA-like peptidoglycan-associated protein
MIRAVLAFFLFATPLAAFELSLPTTARQTVGRNTSPDIYAAPTGVFHDGAVPVVHIEGEVRRAAWRLDSPGLTPLQVMRPLRAQLTQEGFEVVLDCASAACGGFDFRFGTETLPGPNMYVNIRQFHVVTALRANAGEVTEAVTILASTSTTSAYVQIIHAGRLREGAVAVTATAELPVSTQPLEAGSLEAALLQVGRVVLADLDFNTGSTELGAGPFASLTEIASFLALVGHTDSVGGLQGNITISKRRAQAVRDRLISAHAVDAARMDAEGMGYLAPFATNLTEGGREQNRRVEAIVLSSD